MLIAQISDCHIVEAGATMADRVDPAPGLVAAIEYLNSLGERLDLVIGTGDLVNDGRAAQYDRLETLLDDLQAPFLAVPGNHDDRSELRGRFDLPSGGPGDPIDHVIGYEGGIPLVCLDTLVPGRHDGHLSDEQLDWLDRTLADTAGTPTLVVQHHPPFPSGMASMDRYQLDAIEAESQILAGHPHVLMVLAGHYHRAIHRTVGNTVGFACPSTAVQLAPRLGPGPTTYSSDPPALALHVIDGESIATHIVQLVAGDHWVPSWETTD